MGYLVPYHSKKIYLEFKVGFGQTFNLKNKSSKQTPTGVHPKITVGNANKLQDPTRLEITAGQRSKTGQSCCLTGHELI